MSNNTLKRDVSVRIGSIISGNSVDLFQSLTGDTLNVIGPAYKGKAFVPQNITDVNNVTLTVDNKPKITEVFNSLNNIIGPERKNIHAHLYDSYSYLSDNQCYDAINTWLSGDRNQSTFTRILGIGSGIKNEENMYIGSGFNASNKISRGSIDNLTKSSNPQAVENGVEGNVTFVLNKRTNNFNSSYLEDLGLDPAKNNYFIQKVIISADGILPSLLVERPINHDLEITESTYTLQSDETTQTRPFLELIGLKSNEDTNTSSRNIVDLNIVDSGNRKPAQYSVNNDRSEMNYFADRFLERGHIVYSDFSANDTMKISNDTKLLTTRNHSSLGNTAIPDYNSFESHYQTAKTPWVTSQPVNRHGLEGNRENIHEKVVDLFRFYSLDDGEVGNRFRIKVNIKTKGNKDTNEYAKFEIFLFEYEARNNSFIQLDHIEDIDLNPDSESYICRLFGDEHVYYDISSQKVKSKLKYARRNKFLRVEVHPDVENKQISPELMPSGFRAYPHIKINATAFPDYVDFFVVDNTINQMPLLYSPNYIEDEVLGNNTNIRNNWGVVFTNVEEKNNVIEPIYNRQSSHNGENLKYLSPHYFYTKYFLNGMKTSSKNIWVEDDTYLNSFFHLEKIYFGVDISDELLKYTRKAAEGTDQNYLDLDSAIFWDEDNTLIDSLADKLSFDFFTYGGFDGFDIRDNDKRLMNNKGLTRETNGEDVNIQLDKNPLYNAYSTAIDVATDGILGEDILVLPGVSNINLATKCINICESKKNAIFINDIVNYNTPIVEDLIVIDDSQTYTNYYLDKVATTIKEKKVSGDGVEAYKYEIDQNYSSIINRPNSTDSRFFIPLLGAIKGTKTLGVDRDDGIQRKIDPVIIAIHKASKTATSKISGEALSNVAKINNYNLELLNSRLNSQLSTWEADSAFFRSSKINILHITDNSEGLTLLSDNTAYEVRKSAFCEYKNIRKINIIKKEIKYSLFTKTPVGLMTPVLFSQNSSTKKLYTILEIQLRNILDGLKSRGLLFDYVIKLPSDLDDNFSLDLQSYIIRGTIILKLNNDNNNDIINLKLDDILNELSLLAEQTSIEVVQPTI
jgi:hypothetical protein